MDGALRISSTLATLVFTAGSATSAEVSVQLGPTPVISIVGELQTGDHIKFADAAVGRSHAIVAFSSPGGNLVAGLEIGRAIRLKGFSTFVPNGIECASACAFAWLGGQRRYLGASAKVGFHAAYRLTGQQAQVSSAGNALVGAYLNQLGLPSSAVVYITATQPEGMQWLNWADAARHGISVERLDPLPHKTQAPSAQEPDLPAWYGAQPGGSSAADFFFRYNPK